MGVSASFFSRQDERCSSASAPPGLRLGSSPGRLPLWHRQRFQQLLWRGQPRLEATTTTGSTPKTPAAAKVPAATVPATASATVPAPAPAAVPAATAAVPAPASKATVPAAAPNHFWTDPRDNVQRGYVATWKIGCSTFQQHEAKAYCESMGMEPVSLDSPAKQDNFNRLIAQDAQRYFWTGGVVDHANEVVSWNNRNAKPIRFSESAHWSHTGGADLPQPDNRAAGENPPHPEVCLGILNNFYADGIKWHDVACHHKKPTVWEPRN